MKHTTDHSVRPDDLLNELAAPSIVGVKPGLERMHRLVAALGDPQEALRVLHVGGTSGKGSTATIAARILQEAGLRVGLHAKPHLHSVEERFVVDGQPIAPERLVALLREATPAATATKPSWFELTAALALRHFQRTACDAAIVEVGLGGTFDATNVVQSVVAVLTNVGLDHTEVLGDTVEQIAQDKAGIIKPGGLAISGVTQPTVREIVEERCQVVGAPLWLLGRDVTLRVRTLSESGAVLDIAGPGFQHDEVHLGPLGTHQTQNAALAVAAAHAFVQRTGLNGGALPDAAVRRALASVRVPGRMELFHTPARVIIDGAHNPDKMAALAEALRSLFGWRRLIGVVAFKRGHDPRASLEPLAPLLHHAFVTRFSAETDYGRDVAQPPEYLRDTLAGLAPALRVDLEDDPVTAIQRALASATTEDLIVVTGSLYLVGRVRHWLLHCQ